MRHRACFVPEASDPAPAERPIVDPAGNGSSIAFRLAANQIVVKGFVVQGATVGIDASDRFSGYRISRNLIQSNALHGLDVAARARKGRTSITTAA